MLLVGFLLVIRLSKREDGDVLNPDVSWSEQDGGDVEAE